MNKGIPRGYTVSVSSTQIQGLFPHEVPYIIFFYTFTKQYKDILAWEILKKISLRVKIIAKILP